MAPLRALLAALLTFAAANTAYADAVVLRDGQRYEGIVTEDGDEVSVELDIGTITFPRSEVSRVERSASALHELDRRLASTDPTDVAALQALAAWAESKGLQTRAYSLHRRVIAVAPDNERSRAALGHVRRGRQWIDPDEEARRKVARQVSERAAVARAEREEEARRQRQLDAQAQAIAERIVVERAAPPPPPPGIWSWSFAPSVWWLRSCVAAGLPDCRPGTGVGVYEPSRGSARRLGRARRRPVAPRAVSPGRSPTPRQGSPSGPRRRRPAGLNTR